jgi:hypothetical protein
MRMYDNVRRIGPNSQQSVLFTIPVDLTQRVLGTMSANGLSSENLQSNHFFAIIGVTMLEFS